MSHPNHLTYNSPADNPERHPPSNPPGLPPGARDELKAGTRVPIPPEAPTHATGLPAKVGAVAVHTGLPDFARPRHDEITAQHLDAAPEDPTGSALAAGGNNVANPWSASPGGGGATIGPPGGPPASGGGEGQPPDDGERIAYPYEPGVAGIPLDRIRHEMGDLKRVDGETETGSGEVVYYEFNRRRVAGENPHSLIEVGSLDAAEGRRMTAIADISGQAASFELYPQGNTGTRSPDFRAGDFVRWSLGTFAEWDVDVQHIDDEWYPGSTPYQQFQETLAGDEENLTAAVESTWSGNVYPQLGFTEVENITRGVENVAGEEIDVVRVRFSRPEEPEAPSAGPERSDNGAQGEVGGAVGSGVDNLGGEPKNWSADEGVRATVEAYVAQIQPFTSEREKPVEIPTTAGGSMIYTNRDQAHWDTPTDLNIWKTSLFGDQFRMDYSDPDSPGRVVLEADQSQVVAGGIERAFAPGQVVLDVGSGRAQALLGAALEFPETSFIGVDSGYAERRVIRVGEPGVQLTEDDWGSLITLPTGSVNTILTRLGALYWGDPQQVIPALTRVAAPGAVLRFDPSDLYMGPESDSGYKYQITYDLLERHGWQLTFRLRTCIAVKKEIESKGEPSPPTNP